MKRSVRDNLDYARRNGDSRTVKITSAGAKEIMTEIETLEAELVKCREALRMVEWIQHPYEVSDYCPWCDGLEDLGHSKDCPRQAALESSHE